MRPPGLRFQAHSVEKWVSESIRLQFFPTVQAPSQARREVASLSTRIDQSSLSDVSTVVSELVTISVAHGASKPIELVLALEGDELKGTLCDDGAGPRAIDRAKKQMDNSLVLKIVDGLVEEWGTNDALTRIWFRMPVRPI